MVATLPAWLGKCADALRRLADQPVTLFLLLLALNGLARPYWNCAHDARLYSLQVINQAEDGAFADDVFLRYGSQDQFSIFSRVVGPLAAAFGVRSTFFALYLLFNTYFIWGLFSLVRRLFADPVISTSALIFLVVGDLYYGGHGIFTVHEQFFTPRLVAVALVLHAFERLLAQRFFATFLLLALAMAVHPLMAFGGVLISVGYVAWLFLGPRIFLGGVGVSLLAAMLVLLIPPVALKLFGQIDDDWHEMVRLAVLYNYPDAWSGIDWINHVVAFGLGIAASVWLFRSDPVRAPFFVIATLVAAVGLAMTTFASMSPYALLFQGQPYRVEWVLKIVQIPLGFMVIARWGQATSLSAKFVTLGLGAFFLVCSYAPQEVVLCLFALPPAVYCWRFVDKPTRPDWWWWSALSAMLIAAAAWMVYRWGFIIAERDAILGYYDRADFFRVLTQCVPPALWLTGAVLLFSRFRTASALKAMRWGCAVCALAIPSLVFGLDLSPQGRILATRHGADIAFAHEVIAKSSRDPRRVPTVYSSLGRAEMVWLDLHATSYFDPVQTAGVMFNRNTAFELRRRIDLVRKFEMERLRQEALFMTDDGKAVIERLYHTPFEGPPPNEADLLQLCAEPGLDYVVIPQEFPGLYAATNGRVFVYECSKVRATAALSPLLPCLTVAAR